MLRWFVVVSIAGCGRVGFDAALDAALDDTSNARTCSAYVLCDDFEAPALDSSLWTFGPSVTRTTAPNNVDVPQPPFDMWIDDVIAHTGPVSCTD